MDKEYRIIVAGSRSFGIYDYNKFMKPFLDKLIKFLKDQEKKPIIISGDARGADKHGDFYGRQHDIPVEKYKADWDNLGSSAGAIRNEEMAEVGDMVIVFWDGKSPGSKDMINRAQKHKLPLKVIEYKS